MYRNEFAEWIYRARKHFNISELVTPDRLRARGEMAWNDFRPELIRALALLRMDYGDAITINNPKNGVINAGLRDDNSVGAKFSGHLLGCCLDLHCRDLKRLRCLVNGNYDYYGITEIELEDKTPTWLHISVRPTLVDGLTVI